MSKLVSMRDAIAEHDDGDSVVIEASLSVCFAAGHEIIRQRRRDSPSAGLLRDLIYEQMIGAGAPQAGLQLGGHPGAGPLCARSAARSRTVSLGCSRSRSIRTSAWWRGLPPRRQAAVRGAAELPGQRPAGGESAHSHHRVPIHRRGVATVPALNRRRDPPCSAPDKNGSAQVWGLLGVRKKPPSRRAA